MSGTASSSTAVMATPGFNTGRTLPSLANFDFAIVGTAASDCAWPKVPDANMALSLDTVPASPPDACVTDHPLSRDSLDEPRIGVDGSDFLDWPEVQMWPARAMPSPANSRSSVGPLRSLDVTHAALEMMQRNFRKTINADGNDRCPNTDRGITHHVAMFPRSRPHMPRQNRIKSDWDRPRQTDLTSVGMAAHKQIKTAMCSLPVDFRRMGQKDRESIVGNFGCGLFNIVDSIVVRIVDAG